MSKQPLPYHTEWNFELLQEYETAIHHMADNFKLDTNPNNIEIITYEQMIDAYSSSGMPICYNHWSFGKHFLNMEENYRKGATSLAYEVVINSNPCTSYLIEENPLTMQAIVIAHACYGHNSFFKNNYLFNSYTNPDGIIDYLLFAKNYVSECEEKYGVDAVEEIIDAAHALLNYGVDFYKPQKRSKIISHSLSNQCDEPEISSDSLSNHDDNLLYYLEKNSTHLTDWQRELIRVMRKIAQYFYPQKKTKLMNEGWATFWHYTIINAMYDDGSLTDEFMIDFIHSHTNVSGQVDFDSPNYSGINPYAVGFKIYRDIKRICESPTDEDKKWFPSIANTDWIKTLDFAMINFNDESFINQYLSPHLIRELKMFSVIDDDRNDELIVSAIHNESGFRYLREILSKQYALENHEPRIQILENDDKNDQALNLQHLLYQRRSLGENTHLLLKYINTLWGHPIHLESVDEDGNIKSSFNYPKKEEPHFVSVPNEF